MVGMLGVCQDDGNEHSWAWGGDVQEYRLCTCGLWFVLYISQNPNCDDGLVHISTSQSIATLDFIFPQKRPYSKYRDLAARYVAHAITRPDK